MYIYFWFLILFLVANSFLFLEEEVLIVLAGIVWLDAAGGFIRELLWAELEERGDKIRDKFKWYLEAKKELIQVLLVKHSVRKNVYKDIISLYECFLSLLLAEVLTNYLNSLKISKLYNLKLNLNMKGNALIGGIVYSELELYLAKDLNSSFLKGTDNNLNNWVCFLN